MNNLPDCLSRKAIKKCFDNIDEATWDYIFDMEKKNGFADHRLPTDGRFANYSTKGVLSWLVWKGYYTPADFVQQPKLGGGWAGLQVRTHSLAG